MKNYLEMCQYVLDHGQDKDDRTGTGTISTFGYQLRFNLEEGFPLLTTKKVYFPAVAKELLWFISGDTNIRPLVLNNVRIWNEWPYQTYQKSTDYKGETLDEFVEKIKNDEVFALKHGDLGPVYGKQWRDFNGVDQLQEVIDQIKSNPYSRRHIVSAWNPVDVPNMALPPCHAFMQFYVSPDNKLSLQLYQRSADVFLGVPFNIASYALLTHLVADVCGLGVGEFVHSFGDVHIYKDHLEQVHEQLSRTCFELPIINIKKTYANIEDYRYEDIELIDYKSHPTIKAKVSV
ncbi:thymidylate synthase [Erysipelothrix urinaevulpis]|uniref:thymidylate synthase n=1 Tax=Erysipelothrix urinaevulpis TaxID=2683717 RepID=UPI0013590BA7|nr:thymidylate synthase [Erysipelothrix urinaevulpis]